MRPEIGPAALSSLMSANFGASTVRSSSLRSRDGGDGLPALARFVIACERRGEPADSNCDPRLEGPSHDRLSPGGYKIRR